LEIPGHAPGFLCLPVPAKRALASSGNEVCGADAAHPHLQYQTGNTAKIRRKF
jgi:hypothetical protein